MDSQVREFRYAGFWIRAAARVADLVLILAAFNLFWLADRYGADAGWWSPGFLAEDGPSDASFSLANVLRGVFFFGFPAFYYVFLQGAYGQTFGKMAMRIRVLHADGSPLTYRTAFLRYLGYFLCDVTFDLGYVWAGFDPRKQGLHDKVCRTIVVHDAAHAGAREPAAPESPGPGAGSPPAGPPGARPADGGPPDMGSPDATPPGPEPPSA